MNQGNMQTPTDEEQSKLIRDEQKETLHNLKKEIYNPVLRRLVKILCEWPNTLALSFVYYI